MSAPARNARTRGGRPAAAPVHRRVAARDLGAALGRWGRFAGADGRQRAPQTWIEADGELLRARFDRTELDLLSVDSGRLTVSRSHEYTALAGPTRHIVVVQLAGSSVLHPADGRAPVKLGPGDLSYGDPSVPYRWEFEGLTRVMMLRLPFAALRIAPGGLRPLLGSPFAADSGRAGPAVRFAEQLLADASVLRGPGGVGVLQQAIARFDALLGDRLGEAEPTESSGPSDPAFRRALAHIDAGLGGQLSVPGIAEATGMSPRYLQLIFQQRGLTVSSWVKQRRLETARCALLDPAWAEADLTRLALAHGFADHPHFTRSFRAAFGETPSAWRERGTRSLVA